MTDPATVRTVRVRDVRNARGSGMARLTGRSRADLFGTRGVDAVSLDEIARDVGVRKQTVLYWFESKDALVDEVLAVAAAELVVVIDAALRRRPTIRSIGSTQWSVRCSGRQCADPRCSA